MKIVIASDTHSKFNYEVPDADVFIHCGDWSFTGSVNAVTKFNRFLGNLPHKHKLYIPGNHELGMEQNYSLYEEILENGTNIDGKSIEIDGIKFFGTSTTSPFGKWAFMLDDEQRKRFWENAPDDIDVVVSHGPPFGLLDTVDGLEIEPGKLENLGCKYFRKYIERVKPKLACWGHIHDSAGQMTLKHWDYPHDTLCVNAALMNENYKLVNEPITITMEK